MRGGTCSATKEQFRALEPTAAAYFDSQAEMSANHVSTLLGVRPRSRCALVSSAITLSSRVASA